MIHDPKDRVIHALHYRDRVVQHCLCDEVLAPALDRRLIYDNAACVICRRPTPRDFCPPRRCARCCAATGRIFPTAKPTACSASPGRIWYFAISHHKLKAIGDTDGFVISVLTYRIDALFLFSIRSSCFCQVFAVCSLKKSARGSNACRSSQASSAE